jgi:hypothetical protein
MIARLIVRLRRWLVDLLSPDTTAVIPGEHCPHTTAPGLLVRRLLASVGEPEHFASVLASFANCAGCSAAVTTQLAYELAGVLLADADSDADDAPPTCACTSERPVNAAIMAARLSLAYDSQDLDSIGFALGEIGCRYCMMAVIMALVTVNVEILSDTCVAWRPAQERLLTAMLDAEAAKE